MFRSLIKLRSLFDRRDAIQLGLLFAAILLMALLEVVGIASILPFMRLVAEPDVINDNEWFKWVYETFNFSSQRALLITVGIAVITVLTISNAFAAFTTWLQDKFAWSIAHSVSMRLVTTYAHLPYEFFLKHNSADLIKKIVSEVNNLVTGVLLAGSEFVAQMIISLVVFALLIMVQPTLACIVFGVLSTVYGLIYVTRASYVERMGRERLAADSVRYKTFVEFLSGIKAVKTEGAQGYFIDRFETASLCVTSIHPKFLFISTAPGYVVETLAFGGIISIVLYLLAGDQNLLGALPMLSLFTLAGYRLLPSLNRAFTAAARLRHTFPVIDGISRDVNQNKLQLNQNHLGTHHCIEFKDQIMLEDVSFTYQNAAAPVLMNIHLTIPKNAKIAFVGPTGGGKTTLVDLIIGLLTAQEGRLLVDGVPITPQNAHHWQRELGYVPQEIFLYDDTVTRNIAFGVEDNDVEMDRIRDVARIAQLDDFIRNELPHGYETELGERGVRLSGGQRQRVGLARALYRRPKVLVLDEATSALDGMTEAAVIRAIQERTPNLTVILVAHRLSTVKWCERIYLLEEGRLVQHGSYAELSASSSTFREMAQRTA